MTETRSLLQRPLTVFLLERPSQTVGQGDRRGGGSAMVDLLLCKCRAAEVRGGARWRGWRVDLHKFVGADDPGCFHTHPSWALRVVLWGGYDEEIYGGFERRFSPGRVGLVAPWLSHRINTLHRNISISLWIRAPKRFAVQLQGAGWKNQDQLYRAPNTVDGPV